MTNFIPIFPLAIVVYPGEKLNLHIFEPRYKQLITECFAEAKSFGIPAVLKNNVAELGTLCNIKQIVHTYEDGKLDITVEGVHVFRVLELVMSIPDKLYGGAIVHHLRDVSHNNKRLTVKVLALIRELHRLLQVNKEFSKPDEALESYDLAHHAGLSLEEEYELLGLRLESQRLEYLNRHLNKILPVISGTENLKEKIKLYGHFKALKGFNFDL